MKAALLFLAPVLFAAIQAQASTQQFKGEGVVLTPAGEPIGTYTSVTTLTEKAPGEIVSVTEIVTGSGEHKTVSMQIEQKPGAKDYSIVSSLGHGGGACYGAGLCESYIDAGNGTAFATVSVSDSPTARRDLTTELKDGKAVRMLRETLSLESNVNENNLN